MKIILITYNNNNNDNKMNNIYFNLDLEAMVKLELEFV